MLLAFLMSTGRAVAAPAVNVLFYGNSFMNNVGVPGMFQKVALAGGQTQPNIVNASVNSQDLEYHYTSNSSIISSSVYSTQWNYVVLQEHSTKPTNITYGTPDIGNPTNFKTYAKLLSDAVKANSPGAQSIFMQTWSRSPMATIDLPRFYPSLTADKTAPYVDAANKMQDELIQYYNEAAALTGGKVARVGEAFRASGYDLSLYNVDDYHETAKGGLLAALILYQTVYGADASAISYSTMNSHLNLNPLGFKGPTADADWAAFVSLATAVPEPGISVVAMVAVAWALGRHSSRRDDVCPPCR